MVWLASISDFRYAQDNDSKHKNNWVTQLTFQQICFAFQSHL
jgi:hypothetical protein